MNKYIFAIALVILAKSVFGKMPVIYSALDDKYRNKNVVKVESEIKSGLSLNLVEVCEGENLLLRYYCHIYTSDFRNNESLIKLDNLSEKGLIAAKLALAELYYNQIGSAKNKHKMVEYLESAAKLGDQYARLRLASLYQSGELLKKDQVKAENILLSLIEDGVVEAMFNITLLDTMSEDKKINYLKRASDLGHSKAKYNLFVKYKERGDSVSDIKHLLYESANLGDMDAKTALGLYHFRGDEYFKKDIDVAIKYLKEPASNGSSKAQYILGTAYVFSIKSEEDYLNAEHWLMKSKSNGYLPAEKALKQLYDIYNKIKHKLKH